MAIATVKKFTIEDYHRLTELGFFQENDRVELIRGEIIEMAAKGRMHETCLRKLLRELSHLIKEKATLQCQSPIILLPNSEPEPDFAILRNRQDDYAISHPTPEDILIVIEVSDSSLNYDQQVKLSLYAENNISNYWILNLFDMCLEYYSEPYQKLQGDFGYLSKLIYLPSQSVTLPYFPDITLDLSKVFPPKIN